jgi:predicted acetyltransferase
MSRTQSAATSLTPARQRWSSETRSLVDVCSQAPLRALRRSAHASAAALGVAGIAVETLGKFGEAMVPRVRGGQRVQQLDAEVNAGRCSVRPGLKAALGRARAHPMPDPVELRAVSPAEAPILANLLELYCHDLSVYFPIRVGADGRFGYPSLPRYFSEPGARFAFFVQSQGALAGFALATRGSPASARSDVWDVAEFFVLRQYRQQGVGEAAAARLWNLLRGDWLVRVACANQPALAFWRRATRQYTGHGAPERELTQGGVPRVVLELASRAEIS